MFYGQICFLFMVIFVIVLLFATRKSYWNGFDEGYNKAREDKEEEDGHAD